MKRRGAFLIRVILLAALWTGWAGGILLPSSLAGAQQASGTALLGAPDTTHFPTISFLMDAYDARGAFASGLQAGDVSVLENGAALPVDSLEELPTGVQVILAYNTGAAMAARAGGSASIYEKIQKLLVGWAEGQAADTRDDFTLITNDGLQTIRQSDPQRWMEEISAYQPDLNQAKSGLGSLSQALDIATDPNPRADMKRALLYVTVPPAEDNLAALEGIAERAQQVGLRVFVWVVVQAGKETGAGVDALAALAQQTGGALHVTTSGDDLPSLESYLRPLRQVYRVAYTSAARSSGEHTLMAVIRSQDSERDILSDAQSYRIEIQPPNPLFLEPPAQITRTFPKNDRKAPAEPASVEIRILVEFPDGHSRGLRSARLLVDGVEMDARTSAPFDRLTWNLSAYETSGAHTLQVVVEDALGLRHASSDLPVQVDVEARGSGFVLRNIEPRRLMIAGAILLAALALGAVLWIGGRRGLRSSARRERQALKDPVTQPVSIPQEQSRRKPASHEMPSWPRPAALPKAPAWLAPLDDGGQAEQATRIPIQRREMTFGSNPRQATCVLNAPAVEALHARLYQPHEGEYMLADAGSVAGTWVNFNPVPPVGIRLEHGDVISIGQIAFRFELANPALARKVRVVAGDEAGE